MRTITVVPACANAYSALKIKLSRQHPHNIDAYLDGKTDSILGILAKAGLSDHELESIEIHER